jgi:hypothetical protein
MNGVYSDCLPLSARINVDYRSGKVDFNYPKKMGRFEYSIKCILPAFITVFYSVALLFAALTFASVAFFMVVGSGDGAISLFGRLAVVSFVCMFISVPASIIVGHKYNYIRKIFPKMSYIARKPFCPEYRVEKTSLDSDEFLIPLFGNVMLDYELEGDFSDMIEYVDIREYPFEAYLRGKKEKIDNLWQARFKFSGVPKNGRFSAKWM